MAIDFLSFVKLVKDCREAERNYYKTDFSSSYEEKQKWLKKSKELEKQVDLEIKKILEPDSQKELF